MSATSIEMDTTKIKFARWPEMARLYNRVINMEEWRLPKVVLNWDSITGGKGWLSDMAGVASELNLPLPMSGDFP